MIEVERKYRIATGHQEDILSKMAAMGEVSTVSQADSVYLRGARSFAEFTKGDPVVRIRQVDDSVVLTAKRIVNEAGDALEENLEVPDMEEAKRFVDILGFQPVTEVQKERSTVSEGRLKVVLDNVVGLGYFVELEIVVADQPDVAGAISEITSRAQDLGLAEAQLETRKYDELLEEAKAA
ncbi:MAG TPA: class IV adenylate cyclase [Candidatus Saccharimonadales bacterium]|nr:class IV adenylate cyclase [Candidatus Saccharimonadales bacterium]